MKKVINWLKNNRPVKILTVFLAGLILIVTQACASPGVATEPRQPEAQPGSSEAQPYTKRYDPTKNYDLNNPEGGINNFEDVEPRATGDQKSAEAKAKALRDSAQRRIDQKGADNPAEAAENLRNTPFGQKAKETGEDVGSSASELGEGVAKGTSRGLENIKENTQNAVKYVKRAGQDTTKGAEVK